MSTEFNELLSGFHGDKTGGDRQGGDKTQIWIIGTRDQVVHTMNEFYVKKIANDRVKFMPIMPAPFVAGKYMTVLLR